MQRRSSTFTGTAPPPSFDLFSDARFHGYQGPCRTVRSPRATPGGGGAIAQSDDGARCVVAGRESLRVLRLAGPEDAPPDPKAPSGPGGHRVEASRNLWDGSGLKIESTTTDVAWCSGSYSNKILTSARNGDLVLWDLDRAGSTKYERTTKNHIRSIHQLSCSSIVPNYAITGSADGDMRIWDLRDMSRSVMKIHHPTSVRSLVFSPIFSHPLQAVVGLDNGSIYRWDLHMGQRGQLDRLPVAHTGPILSLDWCGTSFTCKGADNVSTQMERSWIVSGGLDHTVKVWELPVSNTSSHILNKPAYVLHPSYPVRRVIWRPEYPCELALVSNAEFSGGSGAELLASPRMQNATPSFLAAPAVEPKDAERKSGSVGDTVEIWDVRRGWIAKWTVDTNVCDSGVTDAVFRDSHALLALHASGTFAQVDLRYSHRPIDAIPRVALSWNLADGAEGALAFVSDKRSKWEVPYDDVHPDRRSSFIDRKSRLKGLGDRNRVPGLQNMGMYVHGPTLDDSEPDVFAKLAKGYVIPETPEKKKDACALNAEVAIRAGNVHAAQAWVLLGSLLTDIVPESMTASTPLIHSASAPSGLPSGDGPNVHSAGPASKPASYRAMSADSVVLPAASPLRSPSQSRIAHHNHAHTPRSASNEERKHVRHHSDAQPPPQTKPPPNSRNLTPASSASSSPRHVPVALPLTPALPPTATMTPTTVAQRRPSILVSTASLMHSPHGRRPSVYSRMTSAHSESPSVASVSDKSSLRHVGEGALDDSDSDEGAASEEGGSGHPAGEMDHHHVEAALVGLPPSKHASKPKPRVSDARSMSLGRAGPAHPSPLSRLAGQHQWEEEDEALLAGPEMPSCRRRVEDDDASPSPVSTDSDGEQSEESEESHVPHRMTASMRSQSLSMARTRSRKGSVAYTRRWKNRSRSSTVASLAAPIVSPTRSSPSIPPTSSPKCEEGLFGRRGSQASVETVIAASIREQLEENDVAKGDVDEEAAEDEEPTMWVEMSHQRKVAAVEGERLLREAGWRALREALEEYADEGDVQMCAMLALVAPEELELGLGRTIQFVEAYVDMLVRYRLHTCAAYLRKYSKVEQVRASTKLETVIYTACRKCRKPVVAVRSRIPCKATHAICATCKEAVAICSICHLPVRSLLFRCSVCSHGGHQECYRRYYMERPMVELPVPLGLRGRSLQREVGGEDEQGRVGMAGHVCAAGCGHVCWAAVSRGGDDPE